MVLNISVTWAHTPKKESPPAQLYLGLVSDRPTKLEHEMTNKHNIVSPAEVE
jgi:hypothetical protein